MGKVKIIEKSRKEGKCSQCGKIIPIGSKYYRGTMNFHSDIIRCEKCRLQPWEVTTSQYLLSVGDIVYNWEKNYDVDDSTAQCIIDELEGIKDMCQENLDNMPESLQSSNTGELLAERIEVLEGAIDELERIDVPEDFDNEEEYEKYIEDINEALGCVEV